MADQEFDAASVPMLTPGKQYEELTARLNNAEAQLNAIKGEYTPESINQFLGRLSKKAKSDKRAEYNCVCLTLQDEYEVGRIDERTKRLLLESVTFIYKYHL